MLHKPLLATQQQCFFEIRPVERGEGESFPRPQDVWGPQPMFQKYIFAVYTNTRRCSSIK